MTQTLMNLLHSYEERKIWKQTEKRRTRGHKKIIRFISPQAETYASIDQENKLFQLCVQYTSVCVMVDFKSVFVVPNIYPFFNLTMHCPREAALFLSLKRDNFEIFLLGLIPNGIHQPELLIHTANTT